MDYFIINSSFTSSIKTRIETTVGLFIYDFYFFVLLHLPLKQGLKPAPQNGESCFID